MKTYKKDGIVTFLNTLALQIGIGFIINGMSVAWSKIYKIKK